MDRPGDKSPVAPRRSFNGDAPFCPVGVSLQKKLSAGINGNDVTPGRSGAKSAGSGGMPGNRGKTYLLIIGTIDASFESRTVRTYSYSSECL